MEDARLVTGHGCFVADVQQPGDLCAVILRSQVARGRLRALDVRIAQAARGCVAVFTAEDTARDGLGGIPWEVCPPGLEHLAAYPGDPRVAAPQPLLAVGDVRYVGEPIAMIIGETQAAAMDAAELVMVEIEETSPVIGVSHARLAGMAAAGDKAAFTVELGDEAALDEVMRNAPVVVSLDTHIPRLISAPIECRGYRASFDPVTTEWTVIASAGKPHPVRDTIARHVFHVAPEAIRLIAPDIGGGFGAKNVAHAEMALVLWAARRLGRTVRWISGRTEAFLSDMQSRDHAISARLAVDLSGRFLGIGYRAVADLGAYLAPRGVTPCTNGIKVLTGPYDTPIIHARVDALHTNTVPTCPYRGAGVPETAFAIERLVDMAALRLGMDRAELRRRNLLRPEALPWASPMGTLVHSVDFPAVFDAALAHAQWQRKSARPRDHRPGSSRGIGIGFTIEAYGITYDEAAEIVVDGTGEIEIRVGTKSSGQGHETIYAQIAADVLEADATAISVVQGDTRRIEYGNGTGASRSTTTGGSAVSQAARSFLQQARDLAAGLLQCAAGDLDYDRGWFLRRGHAGIAIDLAAIARSMPGEVLHVRDRFVPEQFNFPGGCHVAEVEVDHETGMVRVLSYVAVHDAGVAINPTIVEGQLQGAVAQGVGAALMESGAYDSASGQMIAASFLDYALPRAGDLSDFGMFLHGTFCTSNPLGAKAVGEAGTVAAPPAIVNAIVDALRDHGVTHIDLPATPRRIWQALREASRDTTRTRLKAAT